MGSAQDKAEKLIEKGIRKALAEEKYSVELEKLLHDLKERPNTLFKYTGKLRSRAQALRAPERAIWYEKLEEHGAEQRKKLYDMIHKND